MNALTIPEYIEQRKKTDPGYNGVTFASEINVAKQYLNQMKDKGFVVIGDSLYSPRKFKVKPLD